MNFAEVTFERCRLVCSLDDHEDPGVGVAAAYERSGLHYSTESCYEIIDLIIGKVESPLALVYPGLVSVEPLLLAGELIQCDLVIREDKHYECYCGESYSSVRSLGQHKRHRHPMELNRERLDLVEGGRRV